MLVEPGDLERPGDVVARGDEDEAVLAIWRRASTSVPSAVESTNSTSHRSMTTRLGRSAASSLSAAATSAAL